ncbi:PAS domain S-box protein [Halapricum hydrolyticum]|uniref:histidine kinase n=1 Tax=Halapricum hydrolyticum TaxID=2979991 RepID=A0AAE3IAJ5_9EURY|nr:PAS domain S-box protein [Halapricum hydrolyticum]MCU4717383.1 PAS domain S-box protein [Halapricum hydrolyticum]MCU4726547.1 PAS domain S-box protein [Halapricum hydrolyticum]
MTDPEPIRVLHVDSDADLLEVVAEHLESEAPALRVEGATTPEAALDRLGRDSIDCVVSDHRPAGIDGLALLERVRERDPEMPFVLYTSHGSEEIASEAISAGVTEYMQKETGTDQYAVLANTIVNAVEHARAEAALGESEQRYRTLVEQSHDGIFIYQDGVFEFVNERLCAITGYEESELLGMGAFELIHPEDRDRVREIVRRRQAGENGSSRYEARIVTADGETRELSLNVRSITYDGEPAQMGSARDVTDRYRSDERLDEFASVVAHDLRNPLNVLAGRLNLARETGDDVHFDALERSIDTMETLLEDMRELARAGLPVRDPVVVDVADAARAAREGLDAELDLTLADDLPTIEADRDRLEDAFAECFENVAVHAEDRSVRVEPVAGGFAVVDDGPAIPEGERDRVFEAGYTTDPDRTGFGLAIVEWIADAHGWSVAAEESSSGGTRIVVTDVE